MCRQPTRVFSIAGMAHGRAECRACGAMYVTPQLSEAEAAALYASDMQWTAPADRTYDQIDFRGAFRSIERELRRQLGGPGRVLDVGCHTGRLLEYLNGAGWECVGIDPNEAAVAVCRERGLTAYAATLSAVPDGMGTFDAVTMLNTLGCLAAPRDALAHIHELLRPGGVLAIEDANVALHGPASRVIGLLRRDAGYRTLKLPARRLFVFGPRSYRLLAEGEGFDMRGIRPAVPPAHRPFARRAVSAALGMVDALSGHRVHLTPSIVVYATRGLAPGLPRRATG